MSKDLEKELATALNRHVKTGSSLLEKGPDSHAFLSLLDLYLNDDPSDSTEGDSEDEGFSGHLEELAARGDTTGNTSDEEPPLFYDLVEELFPHERESLAPESPRSLSSLPTTPASQSNQSLSESTSQSSSSQPQVSSDEDSQQHLQLSLPSSNSVAGPEMDRYPRLTKFLEKGCCCSLFKGAPCYKQFTRAHFEDTIDQCADLTKEQLDFVVLGQVMANIRMDVVGPRSKHAASERQRSSIQFHHHSFRVCKETFLQLHGIGKDRFQALKSHYIATRLTARQHGNHNRMPHNALSLDDVKNVVRFLQSYSEDHAILLPGRIPGYKRDDIQLLPSSTTKKAVWIQYEASCRDAEMRAAAYTTFCSLWRRLTPQIMVMKPMTDLCSVCQQNSTALMRAAITPEEEKSEVVMRAQQHLTLATKARSYLKAQVEATKNTFKSEYTDKGLPVPAIRSCIPPASKNITVHFSFDMAQQIHYPSDPQQPGPMYFLTPRKCGIFGVCCEGIPRQVNYLIDEAVTIGKGANCTISLLHHFLSHHNFGEINLVLHADNCSGQNKNRFMMEYLYWRVSTGLNDKVEISFLLVGHTKFSPDWCFGLLKQRFRKTKVGCLADIARVVNDSAVVNHAELVGTESGEVLVSQYNWAEHFNPYFNSLGPEIDY